jgi:predicted alpha/beta hydrolase family esterase
VHDTWQAVEDSGRSEPVSGFVLLHGWQNRRPAGHWQHWLDEHLNARGHQVRYPQLPDPDEPDLGAWLDQLTAELEHLRGTGGSQVAETVVVCHSLACALWLHAVDSKSYGVPVDRVLLVAPPSPRLIAEHPEIAGFVPPSVTSEQLAAAAPRGTRLVAADDDPYCSEGVSAAYRFLRIDTDIVPGGAHLDLDAGYGPWPAALAWCLDPCTRFTPRRTV